MVWVVVMVSLVGFEYFKKEIADCESLFLKERGRTASLS